MRSLFVVVLVVVLVGFDLQRGLVPGVQRGYDRSPELAFYVFARVLRHIAAAARIFNQLQFVTVSFPSAQNTLASTTSTDKNADSIFAVGNLSVRYPTTYKKFDRTE